MLFRSNPAVGGDRGRFCWAIRFGATPPFGSLHCRQVAAGSEPLRPAVATTDGDDDEDLRSVDACDMLYENTVAIMPSMQTPGTAKSLRSHPGVAPSASASSGPLATRLLDEAAARSQPPSR